MIPRLLPRLPAVALLVALYALALWVRWRDLGASLMLGDATGPWLVALADPIGRSPHASPFGWALHPPYAICMALAGSLWEAVAGMQALHALAAPLAAWAALRLRSDGWAAAIAAGALVALDGGLVNTALSGSKGYLGATWLAVAVLGIAVRGRWGPLLACGALAAAVMNHPYALAAAPLLIALPRTRWTVGGLALAALLLAPRILRALGEPAPGSGGIELDLWNAGDAWLDQGGIGAFVLLVAPLAGLADRRTRPLAIGALLSVLAAGLLSWRLGYIRDYHLRLLTVPAAVCLAGLPRHWAALALLALRVPAHRLPPDRPPQPGTLGLATQLAGALDRAVDAPRAPLLVDAARISGVPAAEPAALMLDLHLRGWPLADLAPGGAVALLVTVDREHMARLPASPTRLVSGDRYLLVSEGAEGLAEGLCELSPRFGGAWDWVAVAHPGATMELMPVWPCE